MHVLGLHRIPDGPHGRKISGHPSLRRTEDPVTRPVSNINTSNFVGVNCPRAGGPTDERSFQRSLPLLRGHRPRCLKSPLLRVSRIPGGSQELQMRLKEVGVSRIRVREVPELSFLKLASYG